MDIRTLPEKEKNLYNKLKERYSLHFESLTFGGHTIRLLRTSDLEELLNGQDPFDDVTAFPFWSQLWGASVVLAHVLATIPARQGARLLEFGAGLGVSGLVGAAAGFDVLQCDTDVVSLDFRRVSAAANGLTTVKSLLWDWDNPPKPGSYDVIAGSEVLSREEIVAPFLDICKNNLKMEGTIYIAHDVKRKCLPLFLRQAEKDFIIRTKKQRLSRNGQKVEILVNMLKPRQKE
jgi:predicted nicotinamide N-methyase